MLDSAAQHRFLPGSPTTVHRRVTLKFSEIRPVYRRRSYSEHVQRYVQFLCLSCFLAHRLCGCHRGACKVELHLLSGRYELELKRLLVYATFLLPWNRAAKRRTEMTESGTCLCSYRVPLASTTASREAIILLAAVRPCGRVVQCSHDS